MIRERSRFISTAAACMRKGAVEIHLDRRGLHEEGSGRDSSRPPRPCQAKGG
jgi:hypothetical protein